MPIVIFSLVYLYCILAPPLSWPGTLGAAASHTAGALVTAPVEPGLEGSYQRGMCASRLHTTIKVPIDF